ncbi:MAG TPA: hypothetical protein VJM78_00915 [Rhizomicrobium sp.]|nr:hypothetical protein [Rhizomicrobium sp.]
MKGRYILFLAPVLAAPAQADDYADPMPHYVRAGGGFACVTEKADFDRGQAERRDMCLHIGPLFVGMPRKDAENALGQPIDSMDAGARKAFAYLLQRDGPGNMISYAVIMYDDDNRATSVQITGRPWPGSWQFCGLTLGSSQAAAAARLGAPLQTGNSDQAGTTVWDYSPWTFSFEIKDGVVSSIRLAAP